MCGICGVVMRRDVGPHEMAEVQLMNHAMVHRGPDSEGVFQSGHVILGMRRLSIIDLAGGRQPLFNEDRSLSLVANGEIYNFVELREKLVASGHSFRTHSDCETIVHLYEEYGDHCVDHLRGMFAFALWDERRKRLLLGRDRIGEKPLYLYETERGLYFASELKALLRAGIAPFELDPTAVDLFFHYAYVPEPRSAVRNVAKLPAGHVLSVDVPAWNRSVRRYWSMDEAPLLDVEPVEAIARQLEEIGTLMLRSDVPVGVALSGGLDSSLVAALAAKKNGGALAAFSIGYEGEEECDERKDAERLARHLGITFTSAALSTGTMCDFFRELNYWRDDPIADPAGYGYYAVMQMARSHNVPVILQGQGGDELFWGYEWMRGAVTETEHRRRVVEQPVWGKLRLAASLHPEKPKGWKPWQIRQWIESGFGVPADLRRLKRIYHAPVDQFAFMGENPIFQDGEKLRQYFSAPFGGQMDRNAASDVFTFDHPWPLSDVRLTGLICETYLLGNGIAQGDRLSMASSVEMRLPLVDYRLIETVIGLRKGIRDYRLGPKKWLRDAARRWLPEWVLERPKRGFTPPMRQWMAALEERHASDLADGYLVSNGVFDGDTMRTLSKSTFSSNASIPMAFRLMVLETWSRAMVDLARR